MQDISVMLTYMQRACSSLVVIVRLSHHTMLSGQTRASPQAPSIGGLTDAGAGGS